MTSVLQSSNASIMDVKVESDIDHTRAKTYQMANPYNVKSMKVKSSQNFDNSGMEFSDQHQDQYHQMEKDSFNSIKKQNKQCEQQ